MKLFSETKPTVKGPENTAIKNSRKSKKTTKIELSENEIREKINKAESAKVETSKLSQIKGQKLGEGFLNQSANENKKLENKKLENKKLETAEEESVKTPNTSDYTVKSDVGLNHPLDTNTSEKLKTVLSKGAFSFNPKERDVLEKILSDR